MQLLLLFRNDPLRLIEIVLRELSVLQSDVDIHRSGLLLTLLSLILVLLLGCQQLFAPLVHLKLTHGQDLAMQNNCQGAHQGVLLLDAVLLLYQRVEGVKGVLVLFYEERGRLVFYRVEPSILQAEQTSFIVRYHFEFF